MTLEVCFGKQSLKILGRVGSIFLFSFIFFSGKNIILCILKDEMPFKMHKIIFFPRKPEKEILGFTSKFRLGYPKHSIFYLG